MQTLLTNLKKNEGYVSIETIIIAGLIIALGAFLIAKFADAGKSLSDKSLARVSKVEQEFIDMTKFDGTGTGNGASFTPVEDVSTIPEAPGVPKK